MKIGRKLSRREFVRRVGVSASRALAFPTIIASSALGKDGAVAPSERINMGCIAMLNIVDGIKGSAPTEALAAATKLQSESKSQVTRDRAAKILGDMAKRR